jgi:hypothetical protein
MALKRTPDPVTPIQLEKLMVDIATVVDGRLRVRRADVKKGRGFCAAPSLTFNVPGRPAIIASRRVEPERNCRSPTDRPNWHTRQMAREARQSSDSAGRG